MPSDELLGRIDDSLVRNTETLDRMIDRLDRDEERERELCEFMRSQAAAFAEVTAKFAGAMEELVARNERALVDMSDQIRANTRAVLSVLDRLGPDGATA